MERPTSTKALLPVQVKAVLNFLNEAQSVFDLTNIATHRPDLTEEQLASYSIGEQAARNILDSRARLRAERFNSIEEVLAVKGVGEDKVLDIVEFIWLPVEERFRQELFKNVLGENWNVDYWRYSLSPEQYNQLEGEAAALRAFVSDKLSEIIRKRTSNYVISSLSQALLEKTYADRVEGGTAEIQFASWWYRFDEDNWFSFETISAQVAPFINYYNQQAGAYVDVVFYRGFQNGGTVADGITPYDLVVTLNPAENAISIWGISLFD